MTSVYDISNSVCFGIIIAAAVVIALLCWIDRDKP